MCVGSSKAFTPHQTGYGVETPCTDTLLETYVNSLCGLRRHVEICNETQQDNSFANLPAGIRVSMPDSCQAGTQVVHWSLAAMKLTQHFLRLSCFNSSQTDASCRYGTLAGGLGATNVRWSGNCHTPACARKCVFTVLLQVERPAMALLLPLAKDKHSGFSSRLAIHCTSKTLKSYQFSTTGKN